MKIPDFLTSPPPATGWSLDATLAAVVRRQPKGELRCAAVEIPEGAFEIGPVGLQAVDEDAVRPVLTRLQKDVEGGGRAAVVVPSGWLRTHLFEFEDLPRRQADIDEMVMWRLKKLLPVAPSSLRLATVAQQPAGEGRRLVILVGMERALESLEAVFESAGISVGMITPRLFAACGEITDSRVLSVQQESGYLSISLIVGGSIRVIRTKPLAEASWGVVERELGLTMIYIRTTLGVEEEIAVKVSVEDAGIAESLSQWISDADRLAAVVAAPLSLAFDGTAVRERVGDHRLDPVVNVMSGGLR